MMIEYMPDYLVLQNEYSNLVTALPYLDAPIDDSSKMKVNELIKQEMKAMPRKDYLEKLPLPKLSQIVSASDFNHDRNLLI
jgi:hypothetical protein